MSLGTESPWRYVITKEGGRKEKEERMRKWRQKAWEELRASLMQIGPRTKRAVLWEDPGPQSQQ